jgi:hypothetical protein
MSHVVTRTKVDYLTSTFVEVIRSTILSQSSDFCLEFAEAGFIFKLVAFCSWQLGGQPVLAELLQALQVIDMTMFSWLS